MTAPVAEVPREDVGRAAQRLTGHGRRTRVLRSEDGALGSAAGCVLEVEAVQHTGGSTSREVFHLLRSRPAPTGVVTASTVDVGELVARRVADVPERRGAEQAVHSGAGRG